MALSGIFSSQFILAILLDAGIKLWRIALYVMLGLLRLGSSGMLMACFMQLQHSICIDIRIS